jgi:iron complex outermembrane receptor protein
VLPHRRDTLINGNFRKKALLQEFYFRTDNNLTIQLRGWIQQNFRNLPPLMSYEGDARTEYQKDGQYRLSAGVKKYTERSVYQYTGGWNFARMDYFHQSKMHQFILSDAQSREESWFNQFRFQYRLDKMILTVSGDAVLAKVRSFEKVKSEGYKKWRGETGWMLQWQFRPSDRSGYYLISRGEVFEKQIIPFIPSAGGEWKLTKDFPLLLKMNITRNYHKPGLNDLYWNPGGNPELLPEEGFTGEIMLAADGKRKSSFLNQELSFYFSDIRNWILWQPSVSGAWYWEATNIDLVRAYGAEYNFSSTIRRGHWTYGTSGNYAFTRTFRPALPAGSGYSGKSQLIYIPRHTANLHLSVSHKFWSLLGDLAFTGKRETQMAEQQSTGMPLPEFWLLNTSLQKHFPGKSVDWGIKWKVENLLNARYQQILWRAMPERNYSLTLTVRFKR